MQQFKKISERLPKFLLNFSFSEDEPSNSGTLEDGEIETFINENKNVNTVKKKSDLNIFRRWCSSVKEERDVMGISIQELSQFIQLVSLSLAVLNNCTISFHFPGLKQSVEEGDVQTKYT